MNIEQARFNMIAQQIRPWDVLDQGVLDLLEQVRREAFVPTAWRELAFADTEIPLGHDEVMMTPKMEARILQELAIRPEDRILEVGTGSGYLTALLAASGGHVTSIDIHPDFTAQAQARLLACDITNVSLVTGDAALGWASQTPWQAIVLTGSTPVLPDTFLQQLAIGGRLFAIVGDAPAMQAQRITRTTEQSWRTETLFETCIRPLVHAQQPQRVVF